MTTCRRIGLAPLLLVVAAVAGCGKGEEKKAATQVAAKVNSHEITIHQVNAVLAKAQNVTPETAPRAKREILNRLIDQQLAVQQAIGKKLDRSPGVVQVLEASRAEILARAYAESVAQAQPKPTPEEVKKYYAEHPELFAQRRLYNLEDIAVTPKEGIAAGLREQVAKARSMQDIAAWLKSQGAQFVPNRGVRAAEQLSMEALPNLQTMKDGEIRLFESGKSLNVIRVVASKNEPVDEATAATRIEQFLFNQRASEALATEMKQIKSQAKIEYVGEFAGDVAAAEAKAKAEAEAKAKALAEAKAKEETEAQARAEASSKSRAAAEAKARLEAEAKAKGTTPKPAPLPQQTIEKGVSGLK